MQEVEDVGLEGVGLEGVGLEGVYFSEKNKNCFWGLSRCSQGMPRGGRGGSVFRFDRDRRVSHSVTVTGESVTRAPGDLTP